MHDNGMAAPSVSATGPEREAAAAASFTEFRKAVDLGLRRYLKSVTDEPVPDALLEVLKKLDKRGPER